METIFATNQNGNIPAKSLCQEMNLKILCHSLIKHDKLNNSIIFKF